MVKMAKKENEEEEDKEKCLEGKEKKGQRKVLKELSIEHVEDGIS